MTFRFVITDVPHSDDVTGKVINSYTFGYVYVEVASLIPRPLPVNQGPYRNAELTQLVTTSMHYSHLQGAFKDTQWNLRNK